jgi:hypothetical protein
MANYRKTLVCAPLFYSQPFPERVRWLLESANYHGIEVFRLGEGRRWTGFYDCKIQQLWETVKDFSEYDYILFVDGDDSLFATGLGEMHWHFDQLHEPFVISAEMQCWPWAKRYGDCSPLAPRKYRYLNSGGYMATWDAFITVLEAVKDLADDGYGETNYGQHMTIKTRDQAAYYRAWMEGLPMHVDSACRIFQCLAGVDTHWFYNEDFEWGKRPFNRVTKTCPCVFHLNGPDKGLLRGLRDMLMR